MLKDFDTYVNPIPTVCMYVVPVVRFFSTETTVPFVIGKSCGLCLFERHRKSRSFWNHSSTPETKKVGSKFSYFLLTYVPYTFTLPIYFDVAFTLRFVIIVLLLICARPFPFSLFRVTKTLTFKTTQRTQSARLFLWNSFPFALEQKIIFISITLHLCLVLKQRLGASRKLSIHICCQKIPGLRGSKSPESLTVVLLKMIKSCVVRHLTYLLASIFLLNCYKKNKISLLTYATNKGIFYIPVYAWRFARPYNVITKLCYNRYFCKIEQNFNKPTSTNNRRLVLMQVSKWEPKAQIKLSKSIGWRRGANFVLQNSASILHCFCFK